MSDTCSICYKTEAEHAQLRHAFTPQGEPLVIDQPSKKKKDEATPRILVAPMPDLVLRQLLLKKGLIVAEELEAVERELTIGTTPVEREAGSVPPGEGAHG